MSRMTSLERMTAAIRGEAFDEYPFVNPHPGWSMMPHWPELAGLTFLHADCGSDEQRLRCYRSFHDVLGLDWAPVPWGRPGQDARYRIETEDGDAPAVWNTTRFPLYLVDLATGRRQRIEDYPMDPPVTKPMFNSVREVEALPPPATEAQVLESAGLIPRFVKESSGSVFLLTHANSPFANCFYKLGMDKLYDAMINDPALVHALLERHTEEIIQAAKAAKTLGVHGVRINEWPAGADLISEKHYLEFVFPFTRRAMRFIKEQGLVTILEFLGWIEPRLKHLARLDVDCIESESSLKGYRNDIGEYRKQLGREVCLFGNSRIRETIELGDEAVWRQDAAEQARGIGDQRRYVICAGSPTTWATDPGRLRRFGRFMRRELAATVPPRG